MQVHIFASSLTPMRLTIGQICVAGIQHLLTLVALHTVCVLVCETCCLLLQDVRQPLANALNGSLRRKLLEDVTSQNSDRLVRPALWACPDGSLSSHFAEWGLV
jgi:hypothetical protein